MSNTTNTTNLVSPGLNTSSTVQGALRGTPTFLHEHGPSIITKYIVAPLCYVPQMSNTLNQLQKCCVVLSSLRRRAGVIFMKQQNLSMKGATTKAKAAKVTNDLRLKYAFAKICERMPKTSYFISHKMIEEQMKEDEKVIGARGPRCRSHHKTALQAMVTAGFITRSKDGKGIYVRDHVRSWFRAAQALAGDQKDCHAFGREIKRLMNPIQRELLKKNAEIVALREIVQTMNVLNDNELRE